MSTVARLKQYLATLTVTPVVEAPDHRALGLAALATGEWATAREHLWAAAHGGQADTDAEVHAGLGRANLRLGALVEGIAHYQDAVRIAPRDVELRCQLGDAQRAVGDLADAEATYVAATKLDAKHTDAFIRLGRLCFDAGRHAEAIKAFDQAVYLDRRAEVARFFLAKASLALGDFKRADAQLYFLRQVRPDYLPALVLAADVAEARGDLRQVACELQKAIGIAPNEVALLVRMGVNCREQGHDDAALPWFARAASLAPRPDVLSHLAVTCEALRHYRQAAEAYQRLLGVPTSRRFAQAGLARVVAALSVIETAMAA